MCYKHFKHCIWIIIDNCRNTYNKIWCFKYIMLLSYLQIVVVRDAVNILLPVSYDLLTID